MLKSSWWPAVFAASISRGSRSTSLTNMHPSCLRGSADFISPKQIGAKVDKLQFSWFHVRIWTGRTSLRGPCKRSEICRQKTALDGVGRRNCKICRNSTLPVMGASVPNLSEQTGANPSRNCSTPGSTCYWGRLALHCAGRVNDRRNSGTTRHQTDTLGKRREVARNPH